MTPKLFSLSLSRMIRYESYKHWLNWIEEHGEQRFRIRQVSSVDESSLTQICICRTRRIISSRITLRRIRHVRADHERVVTRQVGSSRVQRRYVLIFFIIYSNHHHHHHHKQHVTFFVSFSSFSLYLYHTLSFNSKRQLFFFSIFFSIPCLSLSSTIQIIIIIINT